MSPIMLTTVGACAIVIMSCGGVLFTSPYMGNILKKYVHHILAFSAGVLLVTLFSVVHEALEYAASWQTFLMGSSLGALALYGMTRIHTPPSRTRDR